MKKLFILMGALVMFFAACEKSNKIEISQTEDKVSLKSSDTTLPSFPGVPQELVQRAIETYGDSTLPAVTIAITYDSRDSIIVLEEGWYFFPYQLPDDCSDFASGSDYETQGALITIDGFVFLEEEDLCGEGTYVMNNRHGGYFDEFCGPIKFSFVYEGEPVFKLVDLWCE